MKKITKIAVALLITGTTLFAAGSKETASSKPADMSVVYKQPKGNFVLGTQMIGYEDAEIELTWQPNPSQSLNSTMKGRVDDLTVKLEKWAKAHPNVKIIPIGTTSNINDNMTKLRVTVVEGGAPDLVSVDSFMMPLFLDYAQDISDVAQEKNFNYNDYFPYIKNQVMEGNKLKALWYTTDVRALFYRKDLIKDPPKTVDELIAVGKQMKDQGKVGFIYVGGRGEGSVNNLWGLFWCQKAVLTDKDGKLALAREPNKTALINLYSFVQKTISEGITPKTIINYGRDSNMFGDIAAGNIAMFLSNTSAIGNLREIMGAEKFNRLWGMAPTPVMHAGETSTSSAGGWTNMVFAKDDLKRRLAADLAIELFSSDSAAESWLKLESAVPTVSSQFSTFSFIKEDPYFVKIADYLQTASTRPAVEIYSAISTEAQVALGSVITGESTPEKAVETIIKNVKNNY
ncbi:extracellular solute-binding protein [Treponema parvum]|uniref:extracellular solute-binding protein n=1 Tax=Treponema parvum TaxID=138851 RepID=UPI001AEC5CA1|nr:extracellular solute-binding protein [Treponema parvum]QTQ15916.1 extracellular solute-binding protein [Treponema parvum]